jgi:hypothetical protein
VPWAGSTLSDTDTLRRDLLWQLACSDAKGKHMKAVTPRAGKTHEKPLYDGLCSALPVGANVVI